MCLVCASQVDAARHTTCRLMLESMSVSLCSLKQRQWRAKIEGGLLWGKSRIQGKRCSGERKLMPLSREQHGLDGSLLA